MGLHKGEKTLISLDQSIAKLFSNAERGVVFLEPDNSSIMRWTLSAEPNFRLNFTVLCSVEWSIVYQLDCGNYEHEWRIQNFLDGKTPTLKRAPTYYFGIFSLKLHEIEKILKKQMG